MGVELTKARRVRSTHFTPRVEESVTGYSVYNHMVLPTVFEGVEADYLHLLEHVQVWDVSAERQIEIRGKDAFKLAQMSTPRDLRGAEPGRCLYVPLTDGDGRMINDPVLLVHSGERLWLSLADSDVIWWCKALAQALNLDVEIFEPDVSPLGIQGPKANDLAACVFGEGVREIRFFRFAHFDFRGHPFLVARSGWGKQGGFEVYVDSAELALPLWDALMEAGKDLNVRAGCPNQIDRIEGGLLSYGNDMTAEDTPLDCSLEKYCHLDRDFEFLGKRALVDYAKSGKARTIRGLLFKCGKDEVPGLTRAWTIRDDKGAPVGKATSAAYSPRLESPVALAMLENSAAQDGAEFTVECEDGSNVPVQVASLPMIR